MRSIPLNKAIWRLAACPLLLLSGFAGATPPTIIGPFLLPGDETPAASAANDDTPALSRGASSILAVWADGRTNFFSPPPFGEEQGARDIYAARIARWRPPRSRTDHRRPLPEFERRDV